MIYRVYLLMNQTNERAQRAVVSFNGLGIGVQVEDQDRKWNGQEIYINWGNPGETHAKAVSFKTNQKLDLDVLPVGFDFPLPSDKTQGVIASKGQFTTSIVVPLAQLKDVWNGRSRLFIWGDATYQDAFPDDPERLSEFCVEVTKPTAGFSIQPTIKPGEAIPRPVLGDPNTQLIGLSWTSCAHGIHICYDEDCPDYEDRIKDMNGK